MMQFQSKCQKSQTPERTDILVLFQSKKNTNGPAQRQPAIKNPSYLKKNQLFALSMSSNDQMRPTHTTEVNLFYSVCQFNVEFIQKHFHRNMQNSVPPNIQAGTLWPIQVVMLRLIIISTIISASFNNAGHSVQTKSRSCYSENSSLASHRFITTYETLPNV